MVMFSTFCDRDKFGWFGGTVVSWFISDRVELSAEYLDDEMKLWISVFPQVL